MKIISGIYKGRNLLGFNIDGTRPTMDRVKESLFAMIQDDIRDSVVLDLFSGSGNLGIEALSQGAKLAYLVDKNPIAYRTIKENVSKLNISSTTPLNLDYKKALTYFRDNNIKFNVIFLDPPYDTNYIENSVRLIDEYNLVNDKGLVVCESSSLDKIIYSNNFEKIKEKKYGDKFVVILKKI